MSKCLICGRATVPEFVFEDRFALDCGGDCWGCVGTVEGELTTALCAYHGNDCVIEKHYREAVGICSPDSCIQVQDITMLMINRAVREGHPYIDQLAEASLVADTHPGVELTGEESEEEFMRKLGLG